MDEGAYPSKMYYLTLAIPLLFSSALYTAPPVTQAHVETKEVHTPKDPTILSSTQDDVLGYNCVAFVRSIRPDAPHISASQYPIATTTPYVGAIGKMYYPHSGLWHVVYVEEVNGDLLTIRDGNYDAGYVTERIIHKSSVKGYL